MSVENNYPDGLYRCSACKKMLPLTRDYFTVDNRSSTGFNSRCKKCRGFKDYGRKNIGINRELANKGLKKCKYCNEIKDIKTFLPVGNSRLSEHCIDCTSFRKFDKSQYDKENYNNIKEKRKDCYAQWKLNGGNDIRNEHEIKRYKKIKSLVENFSEQDWEYCVEYFENKCAYCGKTRKEHIEDSGFDLVKEHVVPIVKGGGTIRSNIVPSCNICNSKKKDKNLYEYYDYEDFGYYRLQKIEKYFKSLII